MARPVIVIVGAGFAGFTAARKLSKLSGGSADIVIINPTDYFPSHSPPRCPASR
jgi:NADH dehydrogenase